MKIPDKIHFCGIDYKIIEVDNLDAGENWGRTVYGTPAPQIHLSKNLSPEKKEETLFHELMHIAYYHIGRVLTQKQEEDLIKPFSMNFYGILKDNGILKDI